MTEKKAEGDNNVRETERSRDTCTGRSRDRLAVTEAVKPMRHKLIQNVITP